MTTTKHTGVDDVDPLTVEVIRSGLAEVAVEMNHTLVRTAFNPLLYEVKDFGVGIVGANAELWAEAPGIIGFLGPLPETIATALERDIAFRDGDSFIVNDPYLTGTHISDTTVYSPIFFDGRHIAFAVVTAHWADIGGVTPGGWSPSTTDLFQEGLCFTHQRLGAGGEISDDMRTLIASNVRLPELVLGDLEAQFAAIAQGTRRVRELCGRFGADTVVASMRRTIDATLSAMRNRIADLPDGRHEVSVTLDHDGVDVATPFEVRLALEVQGDRLIADFVGSAATRSGPVNLPAIGTRSQVRAAVKGMLMADDATNQGHLNAVDFRLTPGLVVSPERPAPCDSYGYVGLSVMELTVRALGTVVPENRVATSYQLFGGYLYRTDRKYGEPFMFIDPVHGGSGARAAADGPVLIFLGDGDTPNTPIEVVEARYPVRCTRYELRPDSEGAGEFRGGFGLVREFEMLEDGVKLQINTESSKFPFAQGLQGGHVGLPSCVEVESSAGTDTYHERRSAIGALERASRVRFLSGGGGGLGSPLERDPELVAAEVRDGLISRERAHELYGVVLDEHEKVDTQATKDHREELATRSA